MVLKKIEQELMSKKINQVEPNISKVDISNVNDYLESGSWITEHKITQKLEKSISSYVDRDYAVAVPNGTIAIYLSLLSNGIKEGSRVAVPNITMIATINAIIWAGAEPVIVDVDDSLCMSLGSLKSVDSIDAVVFVPLNGRTNGGEAIHKYCKSNNITLIEDSAHALGSSYENRKCGSLGEASVFSFTPHKIITMGQGGMVLLDNSDVYQKLIDLKTFNREKDKSDTHKGFGLNFKITDLQSSLGLSQFDNLENFISKKKEIFNTYLKYLPSGRLKEFKSFETPWFVDFYCDSEQQKIEIFDYLSSYNIETRFSYPALSSQAFLKDVETSDLSFSEEIADRVLWLPSSTSLIPEDIKYVSEQINTFFKK